MLSDLSSWLPRWHSKISLDAAGLVALADLSTVARRTALTGTSSWLDAVIVCPGLHKQQSAPELNEGEYPACAAMTTGYVFRIENQATVLYLKRIGRTGKLTCLSVSDDRPGQSRWKRFSRELCDFGDSSVISITAYICAVLLTITVVVLLVLLRDWWGVAVVGILVLSRLMNVIVIRHRAVMGWKGEPEPGKKSDLIVLLSQDRWVRIRGAVDDVKAITSGEWLRETTFVESSFVALATLLVYLDAALAGNAILEGKLLLLILLFCSVGLLGLVNEYTKVFKMYGRTIKIDGPRVAYNRRLELGKQLVKESGRHDWALRLGMLRREDLDSFPNPSEEGEVSQSGDDGPAIM